MSRAGLVHGLGVMLWFFAMARIPIAEVTAIGYTAPIFTTIGAALFLGETVRARRVVAVVIGFVGTLVILRPGIVDISIGAMAQLGAAPLFAASFLLAKKLTDTESPSSIIAYLSVFVTIALLPPAILVWRTPTLGGVGLAVRDRGAGNLGALHSDAGLPLRRDHGHPAGVLPSARLGHVAGALCLW